MHDKKLHKFTVSTFYLCIYIHNIQLTYQPKTARKKNLAVNSPKRETERWPSHNPCAPCKNRWRDKCNASFVEGWAPMTCKWLGSPLFISHEVWPFGRGPTTPFRGPTITMVINHLLNGMILQVSSSNESLGQIRNGEGWCIWPKKNWYPLERKKSNWRCIDVYLSYDLFFLCLYQYNYIKDHIYRKIICCNIYHVYTSHA